MSINAYHVFKVDTSSYRRKKECKDKAVASNGSITCCNPDKNRVTVSEETCAECFKRPRVKTILFGKNEIN